MKIKSIRIKNFMSFGSDAQEISLEGNNLSFIVGPNNSGKSNVFRALKFVGDLVADRYPSSKLLSQYLHSGARDLEIAVSIKLDEEEYIALRNFMKCALISYTPGGSSEEQQSIVSKVREMISRNKESMLGGLGDEFELIVKSTQSETSPLEYYFSFKWDEHVFILLSSGNIIKSETPRRVNYQTDHLGNLLFSALKPNSQYDEFKSFRLSEAIYSYLVGKKTPSAVTDRAVSIGPVNLKELEDRFGAIEWVNELSAFLKSRKYNANYVSLPYLLAIEYNSSIVWIRDLRGIPHDGIPVISERKIERTSQPFQPIYDSIDLPAIEQVNAEDLADQLFKLMTSPDLVEYQRHDKIKSEFKRLSGGLDFRVYLDEVTVTEGLSGQPSVETSGSEGGSSQKQEKIINVIKVGISDGKVEWPIDFASAGTVDLLTLLAGIVGTKAPVLLVDEPVQNLHPEFQYRFKQLLSELIKREKENKQIIVVTHSPFLINIQDLSNTLYVTRSSGTTRVVKLKNELEKHDPEMPKKAMRFFASSDNRSLLFSRGAVFVEGLTDKFVISNIDESASQVGEGARITDNEWAVVSMDGKENTRFFYALAKMMNLNCVFLLDPDAKSEVEKILREKGITDFNEETIRDEGFYLLNRDMDDILGIEGKEKPLKALDKVPRMRCEDIPEELKEFIKFLRNKMTGNMSKDEEETEKQLSKTRQTNETKVSVDENSREIEEMFSDKGSTEVEVVQPHHWKLNELFFFIEKARGYPLTEQEKRMLRDPFWYQFNKNHPWFAATPEERRAMGYPETPKELAKLMLRFHKISEADYRSYGFD